MPTVAEAARVTTPDSAVWRTCTTCGHLAALPPDERRCESCAPAPANQIRVYEGMRLRRRQVAYLAAPGISTARGVFLSAASETVRVAALVEIAAAAASLARTIVRLRHLDPALIGPLVTDRTDLGAVLGRSRWLPTMTRHVPAPGRTPVDLTTLLPAPTQVVPRRVRRVPAGDQAALFDPRREDTPCR